MFLPKTQIYFYYVCYIFTLLQFMWEIKITYSKMMSSTVLNKFTYIKRDPQRPLTCLACYGLPSVQSHQNFLEKDRIIGAVDALKRELLIV